MIIIMLHLLVEWTRPTELKIDKSSDDYTMILQYLQPSINSSLYRTIAQRNLWSTVVITSCSAGKIKSSPMVCGLPVLAINNDIL